MHNLPLSLSHLFKHPLLIDALEEAAKPALSSSRDKKISAAELLGLWDNRSGTAEAALGRSFHPSFLLDKRTMTN